MLHRITHIVVLLCAACGTALAADDAAPQPDIPALVAKLTSPKYYERESALSALLERADEATPAMLKAVESADYQTRVAAVRFFAAKATPTIAPQLFDILKRSKEGEAVSGLTRVLARLQYKDAVAHVRGLMADSRPAVRAAAVDFLAALRDKESAAKVAPLLADEYSEVRIAASKALTAFGAVDFGKDVFAAFQKEKVPEARRALVEALGELKVSEAAPVLIEAVKDENSAIFLPSAFALAKIGGDKARDALVELLMRSKDLEMLGLASTALGVMGESAIPALEAKLPGLQPDSEDRFKILEAFGKMGKYVIPHLIAFIESQEYPIWRGLAGDRLRAVIKREYGEDVDVPAYDTDPKTGQKMIAQLKEWWEKHKDK
jgi:HEAT repeat protein